jgi:hypothetical protein
LAGDPAKNERTGVGQPPPYITIIFDFIICTYLRSDKMGQFMHYGAEYVSIQGTK